jgi:hypothetical protein
LVFFPPNELLARLNRGIICCILCRFEFLRETSWPAINARARKELTAFDIGTSDVESVLREIGPFLSTRHKRCVPCLYRVFAVTAGAKARLLYHGKSASGTDSTRRAQREKKRRTEDHATEHGILLVACSGVPFRRDRGVCKRQSFNMNGNCRISTRDEQRPAAIRLRIAFERRALFQAAVDGCSRRHPAVAGCGGDCLVVSQGDRRHLVADPVCRTLSRKLPRFRRQGAARVA